MRRIILACALASLLGVPANALDGTPLPPDTKPTFKPAPLDLPPLLLSQAANPGGTAGQGVDPLIGTWKLNLEKSTTTFPLYKSMTTIWTGEGQNFIASNEGVDAHGQPFKVVFRHIYDGMPHPTTGSHDYDSTTYTRVGNTINGIRFRQGKVVEVMQEVITPGTFYTVTAEGIAAVGGPYHYVLMREKQ